MNIQNTGIMETCGVARHYEKFNSEDKSLEVTTFRALNDCLKDTELIKY